MCFLTHFRDFLPRRFMWNHFRAIDCRVSTNPRLNTASGPSIWGCGADAATVDFSFLTFLPCYVPLSQLLPFTCVLGLAHRLAPQALSDQLQVKFQRCEIKCLYYWPKRWVPSQNKDVLKTFCSMAKMINRLLLLLLCGLKLHTGSFTNHHGMFLIIIFRKTHIELLLKSCHGHMEAKERGLWAGCWGAWTWGSGAGSMGPQSGCLRISLFSNTAGLWERGRDGLVGAGCSQLSLGSYPLVFLIVLMTQAWRESSLDHFSGSLHLPLLLASCLGPFGSHLERSGCGVC